jgi:hypothetical protein
MIAYAYDNGGSTASFYGGTHSPTSTAARPFVVVSTTATYRSPSTMAFISTMPRVDIVIYQPYYEVPPRYSKPVPVRPKNWRWYDPFRTWETVKVIKQRPRMTLTPYLQQERLPRLQKARQKRKQYVQRLRTC